MYILLPGEARGSSTNNLVINSFSEWGSEPFPPTALRRSHDKTVRDSTSSYKIDYVIMIKTFLNPKGLRNPFSGPKVTDILLKGWIWPFGGVASGRVCASSLRSRLVLWTCLKPVKALRLKFLYVCDHMETANDFKQTKKQTNKSFILGHVATKW